MTKTELMIDLIEKLSSLPTNEVEERLSFYSEIIDDYIEEGMSEQEAVKKIGSVDEIAAQILSDIPLSKLVKERIKPKRKMSAWEIVLLCVGSPIWLSLLVAALAVVFSLYIALWVVVVSLWALEVAVCGCSIGGIIGGIVFAFSGNELTGAALIGASIVCAGLSVFMFFGCKVATKGIVLLGKKLVLGIKNSLVKKGAA